MGSRERSDWLLMLPEGRSQPCLRCWRSVSERGVGPDGVVVDAPALGQHAQFFDRVEEFTVEELISEFGAVKRSYVRITEFAVLLISNTANAGALPVSNNLRCNVSLQVIGKLLFARTLEGGTGMTYLATMNLCVGK
jgi:hypothetical protein